MAELETPPAPAVAATETVTNGRWAGYWHLLGVRMRELQREPEVIFWVFVFPLLLALGLGIAFRNKSGDVTADCRGSKLACATGDRYVAALSGKDGDSCRCSGR